MSLPVFVIRMLFFIGVNLLGKPSDSSSDPCVSLFWSDYSCFRSIVVLVSRCSLITLCKCGVSCPFASASFTWINFSRCLGGCFDSGCCSSRLTSLLPRNYETLSSCTGENM